MQTSFPKRNVVFMCSCVLESKSLPEVCRFCLTRCVHIFALQGAPIEAFGNENAKAKVFGASAQPFSIHCDDGSALPVQQQHLQQQQQQQREKLQLHPSITALRQPSIPPPPIVLDAGKNPDFRPRCIKTESHLTLCVLRFHTVCAYLA